MADCQKCWLWKGAPWIDDNGRWNGTPVTVCDEDCALIDDDGFSDEIEYAVYVQYGDDPPNTWRTAGVWPDKETARQVALAHNPPDTVVTRRGIEPVYALRDPDFRAVARNTKPAGQLRDLDGQIIELHCSCCGEELHG